MEKCGQTFVLFNGYFLVLSEGSCGFMLILKILRLSCFSYELIEKLTRSEVSPSSISRGSTYEPIVK